MRRATEGRSKTNWTGNEYDENKVYERLGLHERRPPCLTSLAVDGDELEEVNELVYLALLVTGYNDTSKHIRLVFTLEIAPTLVYGKP